MEQIIINNRPSKAMKMSFSCSSLQRSSESLEGLEHARMRADRPYNSLTKKRKEPKQEHCQRTWGSREDCRDDFWAAIRSNYDYIMDTDLIDSCKEANGELVWDEGDVSTLSWGLKEVSCQFSELYSWLGVLQEMVYSKEENLLDKSLRAAHMEELRRKAYRRRLFNEQAGKLVFRAPSLKDEVAWRVDHLNAKWELVEQIMAPIAQPTSDQQDGSADFDHEVKCLRKWLREMESRLQPLSFRIDWTRSELEEKATEHMVLQRDIEAHGRIVSSVVKLGERVARQQREQQRQRDEEKREAVDDKGEEESRRQSRQLDSEEKVNQIPPASRVASSLERRWHLLFLRALEWQCHIETLAARLCNKNVSCRCSSDSDEEPVTKQPRLSRRQSRESGRESSGQAGDRSSRGSGIGRRLGSARSRAHRESNTGPSSSSSSCSDSDMSSGNRVVDDESYFEDDLEELCVTGTRPREARSLEKLSSPPVIEDLGEEGDVEEEAALSEEERERDEMPTIPGAASTSAPDEVDGIGEAASTLPSDSSPSIEDPPRRRRTLDESASFNTSDRKSKNCATFYFKHLDTDSEADCVTQEELPNGAEESSEEEWTYTASPSENYQARYEQTKANVVVRLDFGEPAVVERIDSVELKKIESGAETVGPGLQNGKAVPEEDAGSKEPEERKQKKRSIREENESDDEAKNDIQKLILEVEKLVREEGRGGVSINLPPLIFEGQGQFDNYRAKYARIKEWLKLNSTHSHEGRSASQCWQPLDSCDASGEYTTGESDIEKESVSSEDLQSSVATYRRFEGGLSGSVSQSLSQEIFNDNDKTLTNEGQSSPMETSTPKVVMRTKRKSDGPRPWSVSCVFQIAEAAKMNSNSDTISQFSISETALHQLVATPPTKSVSLDATGSRMPFNNSTSTLLEENVSGQDGRTVRDSSLRKKKSRLRKKTVCGGSIVHTGSDGSSNQQRSSVRRTNRSRTIRTISRDCNGRLTTLVKSGSFSGCTAKQEMSSEKSIVSDPTPPARLSCCRSDTSTADTEDNTCCTHTRSCSAYEDNPLDAVPIIAGVLNGDSDVEKNSLGNNSFSEQAWDSYQEKYMSEPYSETADVETARRLLDFGDDYRNFLDSQSDCASSMSAVRSSSPPAASSRMHSDIVDTSEESDSDSEDVRRAVERSQKKLVDMESHFSRTAGLRGTKDNMELECVCKENIKCLNALLDSGSGCLKGDKSVKQVRGLTERWENLSSRAVEAQRASALQREMAAMHLEFRAARERLIANEVVLEPAHLLDDRINKITSELASLRERKAAMLALNVSAHRLITDLGAAATSVSVSLKDAVADLYRVWDETFQRGNQQLCALQAVQQFSARLTELQCALRRDKDTLAVLDAALQAGATTEVASSVRDVARLLSEKQEVCQNGTIAGGTPEEELVGANGLKFNDAAVMSLAQEGGTFSDSGISDSGSEQELSERERRLAALRRLTRTLESQLAPGSEALVELWKRVEDAEAELRCLQKQCRELIVRTAASVEARAATRSGSNSQVKFTTSKRKKRLTSSSDSETKSRKAKGGMTDADDPEDEPNLPKSWVWRILRAALPFQLALVALFCAACLLEPHCCEAANTLNLSLTPQLRYVRGPPPV